MPSEDSDNRPQEVLVFSSTLTPNIREDYPALTSRALGICQIISGVAVLVLGAVLLSLHELPMFSTSGIYSSVFFISAGAIGYVAGKKRSMRKIVTYLVLCIIGVLIGSGIISNGAIGIFHDSRALAYLKQSYQNNNHTEWANVTELYKQQTQRFHITVGINSMIMLIGIITLATLIWGSVLACKTLCHKVPHDAMVAVPVQYIDGQAVVVMDSGEIKKQPMTKRSTNTKLPHDPKLPLYATDVDGPENQ